MSTQLRSETAPSPVSSQESLAHADGVRAWMVFVAVMAVLAAIYAAWPIWRALLPMEIAVNEPWNAAHAEIARLGGALYPEPQALTVNNYPPLSFRFIGMLSAFPGFDPITIGRSLSLIAVVVTALCIASCVGLSPMMRFVRRFNAANIRFIEVDPRAHSHWLRRRL